MKLNQIFLTGIFLTFVMGLNAQTFREFKDDNYEGNPKKLANSPKKFTSQLLKPILKHLKML